MKKWNCLVCSTRIQLRIHSVWNEKYIFTLEQSIWVIVTFPFFFVRQTFSASRKGCLGELAASWGGRRRFAQPLSQPWTHLMLLCRGRAECCIFLFPLLCSGQQPCPGVAGRGGNGNSSAAFSWFHMAQAQLARGGWLFPEPHSPGGPHEVGVCSGTWHGAERPEADTGCSLKPPWWATSHQ